MLVYITVTVVLSVITPYRGHQRVVSANAALFMIAKMFSHSYSESESDKAYVTICAFTMIVCTYNSQ